MMDICLLHHCSSSIEYTSQDFHYGLYIWNLRSDCHYVSYSYSPALKTGPQLTISYIVKGDQKYQKGEKQGSHCGLSEILDPAIKSGSYHSCPLPLCIFPHLNLYTISVMPLPPLQGCAGDIENPEQSKITKCQRALKDRKIRKKYKDDQNL